MNPKTWLLAAGFVATALAPATAADYASQISAYRRAMGFRR
jgi:hypothetical protein